MDEDFRQWILNKAKSVTAQELVEDDGFVIRLMIDVVHGRSKSFNKDSRRNKDTAGGLRFLEQEYLEEKRKEADNGQMP